MCQDFKFVLVYHKCLRFDEFDEAIEEAIEEDIKEAEGGGGKTPPAHGFYAYATLRISRLLQTPYNIQGVPDIFFIIDKL